MIKFTNFSAWGGGKINLCKTLAVGICVFSQWPQITHASAIEGESKDWGGNGYPKSE